MKAKEIFNQKAISQTVGIGYDYNKAVGKLALIPLTKLVPKKGEYHMCLRELINLSLESQL